MPVGNVVTGARATGDTEFNRVEVVGNVSLMLKHGYRDIGHQEHFNKKRF